MSLEDDTRFYDYDSVSAAAITAASMTAASTTTVTEMVVDQLSQQPQSLMLRNPHSIHHQRQQLGTHAHPTYMKKRPVESRIEEDINPEQNPMHRSSSIESKTFANTSVEWNDI
jgi:hypothetical protein